MAAPRGSKALFAKVETFIRNTPDKAAKFLGVSKGYARRIERHVAAGKPLGEIIKTERGLHKWEARLTTGKEKLQISHKAESISEKFTAKQVAQELQITEKSAKRILSKARRGDLEGKKNLVKLKGVEKKLLQVEPRMVEGVTIYPSVGKLKADVEYKIYPQALKLNKFVPEKFLQDAINFIKTISTEYFVLALEIIQEENLYFVYDVRSEDARRIR
jgi:hypothetical protein